MLPEQPSGPVTAFPASTAASVVLDLVTDTGPWTVVPTTTTLRVTPSMLIGPPIVLRNNWRSVAWSA